MSCNISREDVLTIIKQYITNYSTYLEGTLIPCSDDVCDRVTALEAVTHTFDVTDGTTTETISNGDTLSLLGDANKLITVTRTGVDEFTVSIDTTGTSANEVFTVDGSGNVNWVSLGSIGIVDTQNTLIVAKNGSDATGSRNSWNQPYQTIAGAYADASAGDTIIVFPGAYTEPGLVIAKTLNIECIGAVSITTDMTISSNTVITGADLTLINTASTFLIDNNGGNLKINAYNIIGDYNGKLIDQLNGSECYIKTKYLTNTSSGANAQCLYVQDCSSVELDAQTVYTNDIITTFPIEVQDAQTLVNIKVENYSSPAGNTRALKLDDCKNIDIDIYHKNADDKAVDIKQSEGMIKAYLNGTGAGNVGVLYISGSVTTPSKILLYDSEITGINNGATTVDVSGVVIIGQDSLGTAGDYVDLKFLNTSVYNTDATATAQAISAGGGVCDGATASNISLWLQNTHLHSAGTNVFTTEWCNPPTNTFHYAYNAVVNFLGGNYGNKPFIVTGVNNYGVAWTNDANITRFNLF